MDPLLALLLELGARAKAAESRNADDERLKAGFEKQIAELEEKIKELTPKEEVKEG